MGMSEAIPGYDQDQSVFQKNTEKIIALHKGMMSQTWIGKHLCEKRSVKLLLENGRSTR